MIVRPVYGQHLFQILITLGATIVLEELIRIVWGPNDQVMPVPVTLRGSWDVADVVVLRFPVVAIGLGLLVYAGMRSVPRTDARGSHRPGRSRERRDGPGDGPQSLSLFHRGVRAGSGLAGSAGSCGRCSASPSGRAMGGEQLVFAFIVVIIGGLGSVTGSLVGALLVGLSYNYVAVLLPKAAIGVNMA